MPRHAQGAVGRPEPQRGSVMIEALVSIVVTSLALLASAALAINAAKVNQTGRYRAQAVMLVNDIAERLTAIPGVDWSDLTTRQATVNGVQRQVVDVLTADSAPTAPSCVELEVPKCSPQDHAQANLAAWHAGLTSPTASPLPQASAQIVFAPATATLPASYEITLTWVERSVGHGGATRTNGGTVNTAETFAYTATAVLRPPRD